MSAGLAAGLLLQLEEFIAARLGLSFPPARWKDLARGLESAARELGFPEGDSFSRSLLSSPPQKRTIEILASHLTVGETYFFRDQKSWQALENDILPPLISSRRKERTLRIWSAGCCTGEEPYSLAILLHRMIPDLPDWRVMILASDINPRFLRQASAGLYGSWSFRETPPWVKNQYFQNSEERRYRISPAVRQMVTFAYLNLAEDVYPSLLNHTSGMDLILCRNVLMYFAAAGMRKVARNFCRCLVEGGWLYVSPGEASQEIFHEFITVNFPGAIAYQKESRKALAFHDKGLPPLFPYPPACVPQGDPPRLPRREEPRHFESTPENLTRGIPQEEHPSKAMFRLARTCANEGRLAEARGWCEKALASEKLNAGHHYLRAMILQEQGGLKEATESLQRALYLDPDFILAHFVLGNLAGREGKPRLARKHMENSLLLLGSCQQEDLLPEGEGLTAGRLREIIEWALVNGFPEEKSHERGSGERRKNQNPERKGHRAGPQS